VYTVPIILDPPSTPNTKVGTVELRWSGDCGTNWSRVTRTLFDGNTDWVLVAWLEKKDDTRHYHEESISGWTQYYNTPVFSPTAYSIRACGAIYRPNTGIYGKNCTELG
jgi:hypothetical protein